MRIRFELKGQACETEFSCMPLGVEYAGPDYGLDEWETFHADGEEWDVNFYAEGNERLSVTAYPVEGGNTITDILDDVFQARVSKVEVTA